MTHWFHTVKELIQEADGHTARQALDELSTIAEALERSMTRAKHKIAMNLRALKQPPEADQMPAWANMRTGAITNPYIRARVEHLLKAIAVILPPEVEAEIVETPHNAILTWRLASRHLLEWAVRPSELPWPGCEVTVIVPSKTNAGVDFHVIYDAQRLLENFTHLLQAAGISPRSPTSEPSG